MKPEDATAYTERCLRGEPASCSCACPFHMDIRAFLDKVVRTRWMAAYKLLRNATVFPGVVSVLCDEPCRGRCQRVTIGDEAIAVRDIEAACLRNTRDRRPEGYTIPPKTGRIAVIGAGMAGLSCALNLAQKKFQVTVFEKESGWGGRLRSHDRFAEFDEDIALQFSVVDVDFRFGAEVTSLDEVAEYDAVYVATGAGGESFGLLPSWDSALLTTSAGRVFMGGELCGVTLMAGIAQGVTASKLIEGFLQTGKAARTPGDFDKDDCGRYLDHTGAASAVKVVASGSDGYTADEAKAEAGRCLQCDCGACIAACEMLRSFRKDPRKIAVEVYSDMGISPFSSRAVTRETYSCNICGHCESVCPEGINVGELLQFSRAARMSAGIQPAALHDFWLREMDFATSEASFASPPKGRDTCEYAFYPGCQLGASNPAHVLGVYEILASRYDMGVYLGCCGAPAYWAGDEARLQANIERIRVTWEELGRPTLVFACATCSALLGRSLPAIPRVSVYELLADCSGGELASPFVEASVFDPCSAREDTGMETAVRRLAGAAGVRLEELLEKNRCCGHGGNISVANPKLYDEITGNRAEAGSLPYLVYCANCREVFASRDKDCAHILDVVLGLAANASVPTLDEKRENSFTVKKVLMKETQGLDFEPERHEWDGLELVIGDDLRVELEGKLIAIRDLKEAVWRAETSGDVFHEQTSGSRLYTMVKPVITYWVEYRERAPQIYEVTAAYCHRMRIERGE